MKISAKRKIEFLAALWLIILSSACVINVGIKKNPLALDEPGQKTERTPIYEHAGWTIARGSLHNHTVYSDGCRVRLIRNGAVILDKEGTSFTFHDTDLGGRREPAFYRVEVVGPRAGRGPYEGPTMPESELFTNPIFVRFKGK